MTHARQTKSSPIDGQERKTEMSRIAALKNAKQRHVKVEPRLLYITPEIAKAILDHNTCMHTHKDTNTEPALDRQAPYLSK